MDSGRLIAAVRGNCRSLLAWPEGLRVGTLITAPMCRKGHYVDLYLATADGKRVLDVAVVDPPYQDATFHWAAGTPMRVWQLDGGTRCGLQRYAVQPSGPSARALCASAVSTVVDDASGVPGDNGWLGVVRFGTSLVAGDRGRVYRGEIASPQVAAGTHLAIVAMRPASPRASQSAWRRGDAMLVGHDTGDCPSSSPDELLNLRDDDYVCGHRVASGTPKPASTTAGR